jgi:hypothetical protein
VLRRRPGHRHAHPTRLIPDVQLSAKAYQSNPYAGLIEFAKNLPANSQPILNLNIGGAGNGPTLAVGK